MEYIFENASDAVDAFAAAAANGGGDAPRLLKEALIRGPFVGSWKELTKLVAAANALAMAACHGRSDVITPATFDIDEDPEEDGDYIPEITWASCRGTRTTIRRLDGWEVSVSYDGDRDREDRDRQITFQLWCDGRPGRWA